MNIHNDENKPVRVAFVVTHQRVEHYDDVIEYMVRNEINRCKSKEGFTPNPDQIAFYKKELIRLMVIRREIDKANLLKIGKSNILNETNNSLHSRA
jgi:hypothetical protein